MPPRRVPSQGAAPAAPSRASSPDVGEEDEVRILKLSTISQDGVHSTSVG